MSADEVGHVSWAHTSMCLACGRQVRHKPQGGPHRFHWCRLRLISRWRRRLTSEAWEDGYKFAVDNVSDPMVYADIAEYGTGWAGAAKAGGIVIEAEHETANNEHECVFVEEQEPGGRLILPPCLTCGLTAMDALEQLRGDR